MGANQSQPLQLEDIQRFQQLLENENARVTIGITFGGHQGPPGTVPAGHAGAHIGPLPERVTSDRQRQEQLLLTDGNDDGPDSDDEGEDGNEGETTNESIEGAVDVMGGIARVFSGECAAAAAATDDDDASLKAKKKRQGQVLRTDTNQPPPALMRTKKAKKKSMEAPATVPDPVVNFAVRYAATAAPVADLEALLAGLLSGRQVAPTLSDPSVLRTLLDVARTTDSADRRAVLLRTATSLLLSPRSVASLADALALLEAVEASGPMDTADIPTPCDDARDIANPLNIFTSNAIEFGAHGTMLRSTHRGGQLHCFGVGSSSGEGGPHIAYGYDDGAVEFSGAIVKAPEPAASPNRAGSRAETATTGGSEVVVSGVQWIDPATLLVLRHHKTQAANAKDALTTVSASLYNTSGGGLTLKDSTVGLNPNQLFTCTPGQTLIPKFRLRPNVGQTSHVWLEGGGIAAKPPLIVSSKDKPMPPWPFLILPKAHPVHLGLTIRLTVMTTTLSGNYNLLTLASEDGATTIVTLDIVHPQRLSVNGKIVLLTNRPEWVTVTLCYGSGHWVAYIDGEVASMQGVDNGGTVTTQMMKRVSLFSPVQAVKPTEGKEVPGRGGGVRGMTIWSGMRPLDVTPSDPSTACHFPMQEPIGMWLADVVSQQVLCLPPSELVHVTRVVLPGGPTTTPWAFPDTIPLPPVFTHDPRATWLIHSTFPTLHCPTLHVSFVFDREGILSGITEVPATEEHSLRTVRPSDGVGFVFDRFRFSLRESTHAVFAQPKKLEEDSGIGPVTDVASCILLALPALAASATTASTSSGLCAVLRLGRTTASPRVVAACVDTVTSLLQFEGCDLPSYDSDIAPFIAAVGAAFRPALSEALQSAYGDDVTGVCAAIAKNDTTFLSHVLTEDRVRGWSDADVTSLLLPSLTPKILETPVGLRVVTWLLRRGHSRGVLDMVAHAAPRAPPLSPEWTDLLLAAMATDDASSSDTAMLALAKEHWMGCQDTTTSSPDARTATETYLVVVPEALAASEVPTAKWFAEIDCASAENVTLYFLHHTPGKLRVTARNARTAGSRSKAYVIEEDTVLMLPAGTVVRVMAEGVACVEVVMEVPATEDTKSAAAVQKAALRLVCRNYENSIGVPADGVGDYPALYGGIDEGGPPPAVADIIANTAMKVAGIAATERMVPALRGILAAVVRHTGKSLAEASQSLRGKWFQLAETIQKDAEGVADRAVFLALKVGVRHGTVVDDVLEYVTRGNGATVHEVEASLAAQRLGPFAVASNACTFLIDILPTTTDPAVLAPLAKKVLSFSSPPLPTELVTRLLSALFPARSALPNGLLSILSEGPPGGGLVATALLSYLQTPGVMARSGVDFGAVLAPLYSVPNPKQFEYDVADYDDKQCALVSTELMGSSTLVGTFLGYVYPNTIDVIEATAGGDMKRARAASAWPPTSPQRRPLATPYFEVVWPAGVTVAAAFIGVSTRECDLRDLPNLVPGCFVYTAEGNRVGGGDIFGPYGSTFGAGDVVGCGILPQGGVFFTVNGSYLGVAFERPEDDLELFPCFGIAGAEAAASPTPPSPVAVRWGIAEAFAFRYATLLGETTTSSFTTWNRIGAEALAALHHHVTPAVAGPLCREVDKLVAIAEANLDTPFVQTYCRNGILRLFPLLTKLAGMSSGGGVIIPPIVTSLAGVVTRRGLGNLVINSAWEVLRVLAVRHEGASELAEVVPVVLAQLRAVAPHVGEVVAPTQSLAAPYSVSWHTGHLPAGRASVVGHNVVKCLQDEEAIGVTARPELPRTAAKVTFSISVHRSHTGGVTPSAALGGNYFIGVVSEGFDGHTRADIDDDESAWLLPDEALGVHAKCVPRNAQGRLFSSGDVITVEVDLLRRTTTFFRNEEFLGTLYRGMRITPQTKLYPFVRLVNVDASAEFVKGIAVYSSTQSFLTGEMVTRAHVVDVARCVMDDVLPAMGPIDVVAPYALQVLGGQWEDNKDPDVRAIEAGGAFLVGAACTPVHTLRPVSKKRGCSFLPSDPAEIIQALGLALEKEFLGKLQREQVVVSEAHLRGRNLYAQEHDAFDALLAGYLAVLGPVVAARNAVVMGVGATTDGAVFSSVCGGAVFTPSLDAAEITLVGVTAAVGSLSGVSLRIVRGRIGDPMAPGYAIGVMRGPPATATVTSDGLASILKEKKKVVAHVASEHLKSGDTIHARVENKTLSLVRERNGEVSTIHSITLEDASGLVAFAAVSQPDAVVTLPKELSLPRVCPTVRTDYSLGVFGRGLLCDSCGGTVALSEGMSGYRCNVCSEAVLCEACYNNYDHPWHTMTPMTKQSQPVYMMPHPPVGELRPHDAVFVPTALSWAPSEVISRISDKVFQVTDGTYVLRNKMRAAGTVVSSTDAARTDGEYRVAMGLTLSEPLTKVSFAPGDTLATCTLAGRVTKVARANLVHTVHRTERAGSVALVADAGVSCLSLGDVLRIASVLRVVGAATTAELPQVFLDVLAITINDDDGDGRFTSQDIELCLRRRLVAADTPLSSPMHRFVSPRENSTSPESYPLPPIATTQSVTTPHEPLAAATLPTLVNLYYQSIAQPLYLALLTSGVSQTPGPTHTAMSGPYATHLLRIGPDVLSHAAHILSLATTFCTLHRSARVFTQHTEFTPEIIRGLVRAVHLVTPRALRGDLCYAIAMAPDLGWKGAVLLPFLATLEDEYRSHIGSGALLLPRYLRAGTAVAMVSGQAMATSILPLAPLRQLCDAVEAITASPAPREPPNMGTTPTAPYPCLEVLEGDAVAQNVLRVGKGTSKGCVVATACGYFEIVVPDEPIACRVGWGLPASRGTHVHVGMDTHSWGHDIAKCKLYARGAEVSYGGAAVTAKPGDIVGVFIDVPNRKMSWSLNGRELGGGGEPHTFTLTPAEEKAIAASGIIPLLTTTHSPGIILLFDPRRMRYFDGPKKRHAPLQVIGSGVAAVVVPGHDPIAPAGPDVYRELHLFIERVRRQGGDPENPSDIAHWLAYFPGVARDARTAQTYTHHVAVLEGLYATAAAFVDEHPTRLSRCFLLAQNIVSKGCRFAVAERMLQRLRGPARSPVPFKLTKGKGVLVFPQLQKQLSQKDKYIFRNSPVFKVSIEGSIAVDMGGPYRDTLTCVSEEIMATDGDDTRNTLFSYVPRKLSQAVMPSLDADQPAAFYFFGQLLGAMCMSDDVLACDFPKLFWRFMVVGPGGVTFSDYVHGIDEEVQHSFDGEGDAALQHAFIHKYDANLLHIRRGFLTVVPASVVSCLTWEDIQERCCGIATVGYEALSKYLIFDPSTTDSTLTSYVTETLKEMDDKERSLFLRFVTGRLRLPLSQPLTVVCVSDRSVGYLPQARTCSSVEHQATSTLYIPKYTSLSMTKERIKSAVMQGFDMDLA